MEFEEFGFGSSVMEGLGMMGYSHPTPIQEQAIPLIMQGRDVLGCAQTGTGKTAAYVLPLVDRLEREGAHHGGNRCLIIAPTRELALQIDQQIEGFAYYTGVSSIAVYGGRDRVRWSEQSEAVRGGADILVATPGRLLQFVELGITSLDQVEYLVLDEADRMLDMGFIPDIRRITSMLQKRKQTLLFSATMPSEVRALANDFLHEPAEIILSLSKPAEGIEQRKLPIAERAKVDFLVRYFAHEAEVKSCIIFAERKISVANLASRLAQAGLSVAPMHSDLTQEERQATLDRFKARQVRILVATDVVARGIDIEDIDLIINYNVPHDAESYVHRIGRTARAASKGSALTLVSTRENADMAEVEKFLGYGLSVYSSEIVRATDAPESEEAVAPRDRGRRPSQGGQRQGGKRGGARGAGNQSGRKPRGARGQQGGPEQQDSSSGNQPRQGVDRRRSATPGQRPQGSRGVRSSGRPQPQGRADAGQQPEGEAVRGQGGHRQARQGAQSSASPQREQSPARRGGQPRGGTQPQNRPPRPRGKGQQGERMSSARPPRPASRSAQPVEHGSVRSPQTQPSPTKGLKGWLSRIFRKGEGNAAR